MTESTEETVERLGNAVSSKTEKWTNAATGRIERASEALGRRLDRTARAIRRGGSPEGIVGSSTNGLADRLESLATYLENTPVREMFARFESAVRRRPLRASLVGLLAAFVVSRRLFRRA